MRNLYLKVTNACTLNCSFCYVGKQIKAKLNEDKLFCWLDKYFLLGEESTIIFHGGEPLLNMELVQKVLDKEYPARTSLTTNLIYVLDEEKIKLLKRIDDISISYDIGKQRFKNEKQRNLWINNMRILEREGINVQINMVLTNELINSKPQDLLDFLQSFNNIKYLHFERLTNTGNALHYPVSNWEEVDNWLCDLYKRSKIILPEADEVSSCKQGKFYGCMDRECHKHMLTINPNGTIATCPNSFFDTFTTLDEDPEISLERLSKKNIKRKYHTKCLSCERFEYCRGECPQLSWYNDICPHLKKFSDLT